MKLVATLAAFAACAAATSAADLPNGKPLPVVDFERHVMGLLSKAGCNGGGCHGSFQGKNGFRLSLFGYEPATDFAALTRDNLGRRVNRLNPEDSLILTKATGRMAHDGGMRFGRGSWMEDVLRRWVVEGARWTPGSGTVTELKLTPATFAVVPGGEKRSLTVTATFADGTTEDVTPFCDFKIADDAVATVTPTGTVTAGKPGDTGLSVVYRGTVRALRVLVPAPGLPTGAMPSPTNFVDTAVFAKLALLNMRPSETATDVEFLRRVTIDTIGILPTPAEVRAFLADTSADKREKKIDELLAHPLHAAVWATKLSDITGNNTDAMETNNRVLQAKRSQMWHDWLRKRVADNVPYDRTVRDILTATSLDGRTPEEWLEWTKTIDADLEKGFGTGYAEKKTLDLFWRRQQQVPVEQWGEKVAAAFLGVRLECCQCHKHPTDRWTQDEYWAFANIFSGVTHGPVNGNDPSKGAFSSPAVKKAADAENAARKAKTDAKNANQLNVVREMWVAEKFKLRPNPSTGKAPAPRPLGGDPLAVSADTRVSLADWLTTAKNQYFAKSFVNRVWAHYFGIGLVNPVDDFSLANPPTNPQLLDELTRQFADGFDLRKLERGILTSRTYQLSATPNKSNAADRNNFARSYVRALMAEQVVDVLNAALGVDEPFGADAPPGAKMSEVGASRMNNGNLAYALRVFGRPPRTTACDCERATEPALPQTLFRMTDPSLVQKLQAKTGRVAKLVREKPTPAAAVAELFLATLSRYPTAAEKQTALEAIADATNKAEALGDVLWALINTREFILNH